VTRLLALGLGFGAAFQAWRNYPPDGPTSGDMLAVVFVAGLVAAFLGGLWFGRGGRTTAVAVATAEAHAAATAGAAAHNQVQVINVLPRDAAEQAGAGTGIRVPSDSAPWISSRPSLQLDQLDGMDVAELLEDASTEVDG
jgi:hypothetical protein